MAIEKAYQQLQNESEWKSSRLLLIEKGNLLAISVAY